MSCPSIYCCSKLTRNSYVFHPLLRAGLHVSFGTIYITLHKALLHYIPQRILLAPHRAVCFQSTVTREKYNRRKATPFFNPSRCVLILVSFCYLINVLLLLLCFVVAAVVNLNSLQISLTRVKVIIFRKYGNK